MENKAPDTTEQDNPEVGVEAVGEVRGRIGVVPEAYVRGMEAAKVLKDLMDAELGPGGIAARDRGLREANDVCDRMVLTILNARIAMEAGRADVVAKLGLDSNDRLRDLDAVVLRSALVEMSGRLARELTRPYLTMDEFTDALNRDEVAGYTTRSPIDDLPPL